MTKKKKVFSTPTETEVVQMENVKPNRNPQIIPPVDGKSDAHRYTTAIRYGKISGEVFCRNEDRRRELGLPPIVVDVS